MKNCPQCSGKFPDEYLVCPKDGTRLAGRLEWEPDSIIRGKYKIEEKIGQGGMASVYKAHHQLLDEPRALKVINAELARDEQFVKRFKNEAINTRKLQHPNAVRVDDLDFAEDGRPFIAMELVEGESLKAIIQRVGSLKYSEVAEIASQVCDALGAAHALGLIHRDIKPDNIVLLRGDKSKPIVKILDFGIARLKERTGGGVGNTLTETGMVIGTPDYMSPEQAMGKRGDELDGRSDLYSLGIVMYRMLTGELPFKAETTVEMIFHHMKTVPQPPQKLKPQMGIPDSISVVVMKALEKDREKRFADAASMAKALRLTQGGATVISRTPAIIAGPPVRGVATSALNATVRPGAATPAGPPAIPSPQRPSAASRPASAAQPAAAAPGVLPPRRKRKFPWMQTAVGVAVLALAGFGVDRFWLHKPVPATPAASPQINQVPVPLAQPKSEKHAVGATRKTEHTPAISSHPLAPAAVSGKSLAGQARKSATNSGSNNALAGPIHSSSDSSTNPSQKEANPGRDFSKPQAMDQFHTSNGQPSDAQKAQAARAAEILRGDMKSQIRPMNDRATQLFNNGMYMKAAQLYRQVLQIAPENERAQKGLQNCMQQIRLMRQEKMNQQ